MKASIKSEQLSIISADETITFFTGTRNIVKADKTDIISIIFPVSEKFSSKLFAIAHIIAEAVIAATAIKGSLILIRMLS